MSKRLLFFFLVIGIFTNTYAQNGTGLVVGDKAPNLVLPTSENTEQSFVFPYYNKVILVFFWSSSVSSSQEDLYKYAKINKRYSGLEYKTCDGFEMVSVALQSDRVTWSQDLIKYNLLKLNNCIALKGYQDFFVKSYKLTQTPTSFLIDEFGKIIFINPDARTIMGYLDERKNTLSNNIAQTRISGKILIGDNVNPLKNSLVYVLNDKHDTIQKSSTNDVGGFTINNINTSQNITLNIPSNTQIQEDQKVYVASENGEILAPCKKIPTGFEYKVLDVEMVYLKPLKETEVTLKKTKELTDLNFTENLHKSGGVILLKDAQNKLDALILKLKNYPKANIEIISYTDCKGDAQSNIALSQKRSLSIANYFISKHIAKTRIKAIGRGESEPLNSCIDDVPCSEAENEINRRTVFRFYETE
jgi:outer membrane protein OmpA-like peptidoglycan-associated protein